MAEHRRDGRSSLRLLLTAEALSSVGDAAFWVGLLVVLLDRPGGAGWVAAAAFCRLAPRVVLGAPAGVLADRFDRRRMLVGLDLARAAIMVVLVGLVQADRSPVLMLLLVLVSYTLAAPYRPAKAAGIPLVVGEPHAAAANALDSTIRQIATFLGPLAGALLLAVGEPSWAFALNAMTFLLSAALISPITELGGPPPGAQHAALALRSGWWMTFVSGRDAVRTQAGLSLLTVLVFVMSTARGFEMVLLVLAARDRLGLGAEGVGLLSAAIGVGAMVCLPAVPRIAEIERPAVPLAASLGATSAAALVLAVVTTPTPALLVLALAGLGIVVFEVLSITLLQRLSRLELLGRVFGMQNAAVNGGKLVGSLLAPLLVATVALEGALTASAVLVGVTAVLAVPGLERIGRVALVRRRQLLPRVEVLRSLALFDGVSVPSLELLASGLVVEHCTPGTEVVRQGDEPEDLYVVRSGTFAVDVDGRVINHVGPGEWFGEIGLLHERPRTATVTTTSPAEVWRITGQEFLNAIATAALPPSALLEGVAGRLARSEVAH
jgi:predicted MFS family arabinose efflux permease